MFSTIFISGKMQIKITMRHQYIPTKMAKIKTDSRKEYGATRTLIHYCVKWYNHFGILYSTISYKVKYIYHMIQKSSPRYISKRNKNICPLKGMYMHVHSSFIWKSPKLETNQMSINW